MIVDGSAFRLEIIAVISSFLVVIDWAYLKLTALGALELSIWLRCNSTRIDPVTNECYDPAAPRADENARTVFVQIHSVKNNREEQRPFRKSNPQSSHKNNDSCPYLFISCHDEQHREVQVISLVVTAATLLEQQRPRLYLGFRSVDPETTSTLRLEVVPLYISFVTFASAIFFLQARPDRKHK